MEFEQAMEVINKLPNGAELAEAFTERLHKVNSEAKGLRDKSKEFENLANTHKTKAEKLIATLKALELDPDEELAPQLQKKLAGTKPATEYEALMQKFTKIEKNFENLQKENEASKAAEAQARQDAIILGAREKFLSPIKDAFGDNGDFVLENLSLKKMVVVQEGAPGLMIEGEFVPLVNPKGPNAVDKVKALFPSLAKTKQTSGGKGVNTTGAKGTTGDGLSLTIEDFEKLPIDKRIEFSKNGGQIVEA
jgi:hypothetical protein